MEDRKVRNEFGLDESNKQDVRNERHGGLKWIVAGLVAFAFFAGMAFYSSTKNTSTVFTGPTATTTGSGVAGPQR
jgi:hypothetical protein